MDGKATGYVRVDDGYGRYSGKHPEGVPDDKIVPIETPLPPPTTLRDFLAMLGEKLAVEDPIESRRVIARAQALREDEGETAYRESRVLIAALASSFEPRATEATVMAEYARSLHQRYLSFDVRGDLVGFMYVLTYTAEAADPERALSRVLRESAPAAIHTIYEFVDFLLTAVMRFDGGNAWIDRAAGKLADETEAMLDRATNARSVGGFYGALFEAVPLAFGAMRAYKFLASATTGDISVEYQRLANVSDERFVSSLASLEVDFANSMDFRYLLDHRREIEKARRQKGEWAAARLADQRITLEMLYPSFFRPFLLGQNDTLKRSVADAH